MEAIVQEFMERHEVPGLSLAIAKDDRMVCARAFGMADRDAGRPVTAESLFRIASISKPVTAVTIFTLIEQGALRLADRVFGDGGVLGTTYGTRPYKEHVEEITVDNLLAHTSGGWLNDDNDPMFLRPELDHAELISWTLDNQSLAHAPGTNYAYSNFGYCVLGRIIERLTDLPYAEAVQRRVLGPCGVADMRIAGNRLADRQPAEVVYYSQDEGDPYTMQVSRMDSHGGWIANATDLVRFAIHVDGVPQEPDILRPETVHVMATASAANPAYARGWAVNEAGNWWHGGSLPGTATVLARTAGGFCWAALTNTRRPGLGADLDKLMWAIVAGL
jgi:D-alanyl-D-alanine carboxypeptidase